MEAIRVFKKIINTQLAELEAFKGQDVEIIILSNEPMSKKKENIQWLDRLKGTCPNLPDGMEFQTKIRKEWNE